jgi:hypothetical protein
MDQFGLMMRKVVSTEVFVLGIGEARKAEVLSPAPRSRVSMKVSRGLACEVIKSSAPKSPFGNREFHVTASFLGAK